MNSNAINSNITSISQTEATKMQTKDKLFNKNYLLLIQGSFVSRIGDIIYSVAIGYFVYSSTGSEALMGIFSSINMLVQMFLSPVTGAVIDRLSRKVVIVSMDMLRGLIMVAIGLLALFNNLTVTTLMGFTVLSSLSAVMFNPAAGTLLIDLVSKKHFVRASSISSTISMATSVVGQGLSGVLLVTFGVGPLIIFNGCSFIFSAVTECFIDIPKTPKQGTKVNFGGVVRDVKEGFLAMVTTRGLNTTMFIAFPLNFLLSGVFALLLVMCTEKGFTIEQYGFIMALYSVGGLFGSMVVATFKVPSEKRMKHVKLTLTLQILLEMLAFLSGNIYLFTALLFIAGFLNAYFNTIMNAMLIMLIPEDKRASILGFMTTFSTGGSALSALVYGFLGEIFLLSHVAVGGVILCIPVLVILIKNKSIGEEIMRLESGSTNA